MKIYSFSFISDLLFTAFSAFLTSLVIIGYFAKQPYSIIISAFLSIIITATLFYFVVKRKKKKSEEISLRRIKEATLSELCIMQKPALLSLFFAVFNKRGYKAEKNRSDIFLTDKKIRVFTLFSFDGLKKSDVVRSFNYLKKDERAVIFCYDISEDVKDFVIRFDGKVNVIYGLKVYDVLKDADMLPKIKLASKTEKRKKAEIKNFFNKNRAKRLFIFGATFLILSFFVPFKLYYVISGSLLLVFACVSRIFGKSDEQPEPV